MLGFEMTIAVFRIIVKVQSAPPFPNTPAPPSLSYPGPQDTTELLSN